MQSSDQVVSLRSISKKVFWCLLQLFLLFLFLKEISILKDAMKANFCYCHNAVIDYDFE